MIAAATITTATIPMHHLRSLIAAVAALLLLTFSVVADDSKLVIGNETDTLHAFTVEVVDTFETRARGLMFREQLAPDAGMLFDFKESRQVAFWMENTLIPLDMIFIRADGTIANIHVNAKPLDRTSIPSDGPVMFVLEIPGGRSVELGIKAGDLVMHDRIQRE
jgi:uncharacterized membrane protein (UPF0127 family)